MTVKELIEHLQTLDPELRVFTRGYEGGYEDAGAPVTIRNFILNYHEQWYYGPHEITDEYSDIKGIIL
jgi:hypothetical protein